jgi:hypothetical protein
LSKDAKQTKVQNDFQIFLQRRATYVTKAVQNLVNGRDISANEIMDSN